ncbi:beta-ketoacyl synthase N-terminal-like domain-containing protein [Streptomyces sp. JHA26]|uniref:beta-ketoacyl synthase N-terminal-like domain-containing protein n=1 Tax=Streptomyces sp. JHA26 TaxID=1917143 RepID=UPI000989C711|nr:beta-ketoacyl synthase N-terminal-like domain-containing protein [Streptomyces sp. JHA26]
MQGHGQDRHGTVEHTVILSAASAGSLRRYAGALYDHLAEAADHGTAPSLASVAFTLQTGRVSLAHRLAIRCAGTKQLLEALAAAAAGRPHPAVSVSVVEPGTEPGPLAAPPRDEHEAAQAWLAGHTVRWEDFRHEGATRTPLPGHPFGAAPTDRAGRAPAPRADRDARRTAVEEYLKERYAEVSEIPAERLHARVPLDHYGLSSALVARLTARLTEDLGTVPPTLFFEHRDLAGVAGALLDHDGPWRRQAAERAGARQTGGEQIPAEQARAEQALAEPSPGRKGAALAGSGERAVAVVGIAGRYPQAPDLERFWDNLVSGRDCVGQLPPDRRRPGWPADDMWGGFLDDVDLFDPLLFQITPRDAALMDPQERLFLETTWRALEDAGYPRTRLREQHGSRVSVYAGSMYNEYTYFGVESTLRGAPQDTGCAIGGIANRVSFHFDLRGPSMTVDTMCSSGLVAVHLAVQALRRGECEMAVAGAVNLSLHPNKFLQQRRMRLTASGRRCRSFGRGGDGFVPAEGVGVLVLKPLDRALADGDRIHAVVRGSAVLHMGRTNGWIVPNPAAQAEVVAEALRDAGLDPADIGYLEAHGAGTELGDPIEIEGLTRVFGAAGLPPGSIPVGSVKSTIGHVEAGAGVAALTKVLLQMRHRRLAPSLHAGELNPGIDWDAVPFRVQRSAEEWRAAPGAPLRAGISSFGAGGTIAHLVLESHEPVGPRPTPPVPDGRPRLLVLSAHDERRLREYAGAVAEHLRGAADSGAEPALGDLAFTLGTGREPLRERLAFVARDTAGAAEVLGRYAAGDDSCVLRGRTPGPGASTGPVMPAEGFAEDERELCELGAHWVAGGPVDWARLRPATGPGPAIVPLPGHPFARMRCWAEPASAAGSASTPSPKQPERFSVPAGTPVPPAATAGAVTHDRADSAAAPAGTGHAPAYDRPGGAAETPLLRRTWVESVAEPDPTPVDGPLLCLFADPSEAVARELVRAAGPERIVLLRRGADRGDGVAAYTGEADAVAAVGELLAHHPGLAGWIDLCDHADSADGGGEDPDGDWTARLAALRRLVSYRAGHGLRVLHVTRGLRGAGGVPPRLTGARLAGYVRMLGAEYRRVRATTVDTDLGADDASTLARQLLEEVAAYDRHGEVCHRAGTRLVPSLASVTAEHRPLRIPEHAVQVLTGATRGIGARVARHLVECGARRLVLLGARSLPPREQWSRPDLSPRAAEAVATVRRLEAMGARLRLHTGELTDAAGVGTFLDGVRREWGPVAGVVHCAGRVAEGDPAFAHRGAVLARRVWRPKADALAVLADACATDRPAYFVTFSSVCAAVPRLAAGVSDYAAANSYADFFTEDRVRRGRTEFRSVDWPMWAQSGQGAGGPNVCEPVGLAALDDAAALRVLERVLSLPDGGTVLPCPPLPGVGVDHTALLAVRPPEPDGSGQVSAPASSPAGAARLPRTAQDLPPAPWLMELFAENLGIPVRELDPTADFAELGVESVLLGDLLQQIEERVGRPLEPSTLLRHSTVAALTRHLDTVSAARPAPRPEPEHTPEATGAADPEPVAAGVHRTGTAPGPAPVPAAADPVPAAFPGGSPAPAPAAFPDGKIAVIGLACRFPGASDIDAFWADLVAGRCRVTEVPPSRWDHHTLYAPTPQPGRSLSKWGGFVDGIEDFDPDWFGMTEDEATALDPAIRLFLEVTACCLAEAGYTDGEVWGRRVGVYVGGRTTPYGRRAGIHPGGLQSDPNFIAAQVAHRYNFRGPSMVVDSACSSSLVAVQLACRALAAGDAEIAVAGGVEVLLDERPYLEFSAARAISPSGRCRTFDERADGFVPGEGCGAVLLKPLRAALADGDRIHAVIDAAEVNNDGNTMGVTTPNPDAQAELLRRALAASGRHPEEIGLLEAHGTGTLIGDPMELRALTDVFRESSDREAGARSGA